MALSYVGGKTIALAGTTSNSTVSLTGLAGGTDSAPAAGDLVIVGYCVGWTSAPTTPHSIISAGYVLDARGAGAATRNTSLLAAHKVMGATPDTSVVLSSSGSPANAIAVAIQVWRGADASVLDVAATTAVGTTGQADPPAITPATAGAYIIAIGAGGSITSSTSPFTSSDLNNFLAQFSTDTAPVNIGMGSRAWSTGAFNPAKFGGGYTSTQGSWVGITLALRPAPDAPALTGSVTFDPAKTNSLITLTDSNMAITGKQVNDGVNEWSFVTAALAGKQYAEFYMNELGANAYQSAFGLGAGADLSFGLSDGLNCSMDGYCSANGVSQNSNTLGSVNTGGTAMIATDAFAGLVWLGANGVWWNGDPAAGTGGYAYACADKFVGASLYVRDDAVARKITGRFAAADQTYPAPAGFTALDSAAAPITRRAYSYAMLLG